MAQNLPTPSLVCPSPVLRPGGQAIDRVAVDDANAQITVVFLAPITPAQQTYMLNPLSYTLTGGQRLFPRILSAALTPQGVLLSLDQTGDFSIYTLTVSGPDIDLFFGSVKLRFRLGCDDRFDCRAPALPPTPEPELPVAIDYQSKDYASFRQALLDFIPTRLPAWTERSEADIGMMLLELFAATADNLSYVQDRVANEAFLDSATQRRSVAGHLALIGYQMDEGASAHTWLQFQVSAPQILPASPGFKVSNRPSAIDEPVLVFETLGEIQLDPAHNQMSLYDWGNSNCCLPSEALSAALVGSLDSLKAGDYLLLDNGHGNRDIVQLTAAPAIFPIPAASGFYTVVTWSEQTPLANDYCVAGTVVCGNLAPASHGETVTETLRNLTPQQKTEALAEAAARRPGQRIPRQRLTLTNAPLAHLDPETPGLAPPVPVTSANTFGERIPRGISTLAVFVDEAQWQQRSTLLDSQPGDQVFRLEIDDQGDASIVFGDGVFGKRPTDTSTVTATYRVGGGSRGNIGAGTLTLPHPDGPTPWLVAVTNPLPATGGRDLESRDHARRIGPATFHDPLVAVTTADYQTTAAAFVDANGKPIIQRANAGFRWTGSWLTVTVATDPIGAIGLTPTLRSSILDYLGAKRLAGYDLEVTSPTYVPVELELQFAILPGSQQGDVQQALLLAFSNGVLPGGAKGFFHPDNFTFGDSLYISRIFAAAMAVPGVKSVEITGLARLHAAQPAKETAANLAQGFLAVGLDQIVRLDNDRNFPQNGTLSLRALGGQA